jgi:uroporphyrinogen decarboxylase
MAITPCRQPWGGAMTPRERFNRQMHHQRVDRCFNMEFGYWQENFSQWDIFVENNITNNDEGHEFFALDPIFNVGGANWLLPGFESKVIEDRGDSVVVQNSDGLTAEMPKDDHSTIPHYTDSQVKTPEDWNQVKAERMQVDDPARQIDVDAILAQHPNDRDYPLGVDCGSMIGRVRNMLTFEGLAYACYDYPDMVEDMVETTCQIVEHNLDQLLGKIDFDYASGWEDICFKNGPIVSVDFMEKVVGPRYKRIGDKLHEHGIDLWYTDCDGDVRPILHVFLENGINCMFPYEVMGGGHPGELLDDFGPQLRIMGGFDKTKLVAGKDAITSYMESLVPYVVRGGFIPFCDHRCPPDVTPENYLYYLDLKEKTFGPDSGLQIGGE